MKRAPAATSGPFAFVAKSQTAHVIVRNARIGQIQLLQPFVALAGAAALLGETVGWLEIGFAVLVVGIVALGWRMRVVRPA
jgi:drug/metabolite transporter (DMT)-like permease